MIRVISFPGIDRSIPMRVIEEGERFSARYYRNKRLGEFLKELDLSEGKSTGVPTIQEELRNNGSPKARFTTDEDRRALTVEIPIHPDFLENNEKPAIERCKTGDSNEKPVIERYKTSDSSEKPVIGTGVTADLAGKTILDSMIESMQCRDKMKQNIRMLYKELGDEVFGRKDIVRVLGLSYSVAGDLIARMNEVDLIEPVTGKGKGKYKFL